jgi:hypothetical protein
MVKAYCHKSLYFKHNIRLACLTRSKNLIVLFYDHLIIKSNLIDSGCATHFITNRNKVLAHTRKVINKLRT